MKTTLKEILSHNPCGQVAGSGFGWDLLTKTLDTKDPNTEVDLMTILKSNGIKDATWALQTQKYLDYCLFLADIADITLPVFEAFRPHDSRVKDCIQAVRDFQAGKITSAELESAAAKAAKASIIAWSDDSTWSAAWAARTAKAAAEATWSAWSVGVASWAVKAAGSDWTDIEKLFVKHFG